MNVRQILVMTDFSENARVAYACAASLASTFDADLHLVHFAGALPSFIPGANRGPFFEKLQNEIVKEASTHPSFAGVSVKPRLERHRWTRTQQQSLEQDLGIDLIVMSPQGRTGLAKMLLGSFADRVVRHSSVPVLLFRPTESTETLDPRTVLVPHDFYDRPQTILPAMRWLASQFNCKFRFLHVYDPSWANWQSIRGIEQQFAQALKGTQSLSVDERFTKLVDDDLQGLNVTLETAQGIPSVQVIQRTNQIPAALVLLGKREGLGSVARSVTREAKCSVLTVPVTDAED